MKTLLEDWDDACCERSDIDKSYFLSLIKDFSSPDDLRKIFDHFPHAEELTERTLSALATGNLLNSLYLTPNHTKKEVATLEAAKNWLDAQGQFFKSHKNYEFFNICESVKIERADLSELKKYRLLDTPSKWFFDYISDEVRASRIVKSRKVYYLHEALYGLAADYYMTYYIMQPLIDLDIDFEPYFNFWKLGGTGVITEKNYFVAVTGPNL